MSAYLVRLSPPRSRPDTSWRLSQSLPPAGLRGRGEHLPDILAAQARRDVMELENRPPELSMNIVAGLALGAFPIRSLFQSVTDGYCAIDQEQFPILRSGAIIISAK